MNFPIPEYHHHEEFQNRTRKLAEIRALGVDPYPPKYVNTLKCAQITLDAETKDVGHHDDAASGNTQHVFVSGRLVLFRAMGKNAFAHIQDETGRIQIMCNRDLTKVAGLAQTDEITPIKFIEKKLDLGDMIGIEGHLFKTQKGELTIFAKNVTLLCKSLLPLPDKHSGLVDKGVRYRKRWLDLITHPESLERFRNRSRILLSIRNYLEEREFEEVETPVLQNSYGGAQARPFITHLNALSQDMYLRISLEIPLKKLIVGGMQKIYEIGKVFRNEGIDRTHNPEFTMLEAYAAGWDYNDMMDFTENLFETVALNLFGTTKIRVTPDDESTAIVIDVKAPWARLTMKEAIKTFAHLDVDKMTDDEMKARLLKETHIDPKGVQHAPRGALISMLFEEFAEKHLIQPHHIIDHPIETTPLCKPHRDPELRKQGFVERFESFILGREMCNSYSELNDPELQRELLVSQAEKREKGDVEANPLDEEFVEAICQGMPPTGGVGIGIDRLVMLFANADSIRDILLFPLMRPEDA
ncbi:MAG: lysine--tRNA ligase [Chlamydiae bacterium CG10_big_fil_rev_8_21_14_0_10_42_34]|nr:MAG: lysine--tRNA ligase [Chlamydiae bacterium CG10_big_fil_rev_8_21_14_0_10_42_34]